jgi:hypothetical protein
MPMPAHTLLELKCVATNAAVTRRDTSTKVKAFVMVELYRAWDG